MLRASMLWVVVTGCTGLSLGENEPGGDTWVEPPPPQPGEHRMGALAVERDEDQLWVVHEENRESLRRAHLSAIDPVSGRTYEVVDLTGTSDRRVVFPSADRMIVMAQRESRDQLLLIDTNTRTIVANVIKPTWYWGTRTAPSGRALVVADNADPLAPLHLIDTATLAHQVVPHGGEAIEAMWNHSSDVLFALSVTDPFGPQAVATVLRFDLDGAMGPMPSPTRTWSVPGYGWDFWFSFTWISISPDDRWAVFPLIDRRPEQPTHGQHMLLVLDQSTGETSVVPGMGPAGFTRDGRWIVSYGTSPDGGQDLWLIDPMTHVTKIVEMPFVSGISFHPSRDSDHIVVTGIDTIVYDATSDIVRPVATPISLNDFVTRRGHAELWLQSSGSVYALDLATATVATVSSQTVTSINVRPAADQAVIGNGYTATIERLSMATRQQSGDPIQLPSPINTPAAASIATRSVAARFTQSPFDPAYDARDTFDPRQAAVGVRGNVGQIRP